MRTTPMRTTAVASALVLAAVPLLSGCSDGGGKHWVTYEATGSQLFEVEYDRPGTNGLTDSIRKVIQLSADGKRKWTKTVQVESLDNLSLTAAGSGRYESVSRVACALSVDGELKQKAVAKTGGETVSCNADGSGRNG